MHGITNKLTLGKGHHFFQSFGWQAHGVPAPRPCGTPKQCPWAARLLSFKRCHCIGILAAPPDCLVCMVPLGLGLQPVSSFTAKRQLVGGLARQTGHNGALYAVAAIGCWHVAWWGVHTGTCIVGCSLKQPARPPTRHTPIFRLFRKRACFFWALQAITQKTLSGGAGFFCVATRMQILERTNAKLL